MEDVLTEAPPPSRFFIEDLNNFAPPSPSLPYPFLVFSNPNATFNPSLLIIAISSPSLHFSNHIPSKSLIGTLILPETPLSGNSINPSPKDNSCNIYTLNETIIISVQYPISSERSHSIAKLLIGEKINPEQVLILDSVQSRNFRGKLSLDDTYAFKLETLSERKNGGSIKGIDYFPSGSVVDGFAAALLSRCQVKKIKGTLCVTWPEFGVPVTSLVKSLLLKVLPGVDYIDGDNEFTRSKDSLYDSDLYT